MKVIVLFGICAVAQIAWVHGATRAQKVLMTPLSLDAAQVRSIALSDVTRCLKSPGPELLALTGGSSGRFQELYRVIWQEVHFWCGVSEAPSILRSKCEVYSCAQQLGRHIQGEYIYYVKLACRLPNDGALISRRWACSLPSMNLPTSPLRSSREHTLDSFLG